MRRRRLSHSEAGFAVLDALIALLLISIAMIGALSLLAAADRVASLAYELVRARTALAWLLLDPAAPEVGVTSRGETWSVSTEVLDAAEPVAVCLRRARFRSPRGAEYASTTYVACPLPGGPQS